MKKILFLAAVLFATATTSASAASAPVSLQEASNAHYFYLEILAPTEYYLDSELHYVPVQVRFYPDAPTEPFTVFVNEDEKLMWIEDQTDTGFTIVVRATLAGEPEKYAEVRYKDQVERITFNFLFPPGWRPYPLK